LLNHPRVRAALEAGTTVRLTHPDTNVTRELYDVPDVVWKSGDNECTVRIIVARSRKDPDRPVRIGKLIGQDVYELFVTTADPAGFHAADIVSMYLHRGQFEATLAQEDREVPADRWITYSPQGQEIWQILCQWVWNLDLWLGRVVDPTKALVRETDFTPEIQTLPEVSRVISLIETPTPATSDDTTAPEQDPGVAPTVSNSPDRGESTESLAIPALSPSPSETLIFQRDDSGTMRCPAGEPMRFVETRKVKTGIRHRLQVAATTCATCTLRASCRGPEDESFQGRRITVAPGENLVVLNPANRRVAPPMIVQDPPPPVIPSVSDAPMQDTPATTTTPPDATTSITWIDLPARATRAQIQHGLENLVIGVLPPAVTSSIVDPIRTEPARDRRAHRRHTWLWSIRRNALPPDSPVSPVLIHGIPPALAAALLIPIRS
jgi:hypothetical protein